MPVAGVGEAHPGGDHGAASAGDHGGGHGPPGDRGPGDGGVQGGGGGGSQGAGGDDQSSAGDNGRGDHWGGDGSPGAGRHAPGGGGDDQGDGGQGHGHHDAQGGGQANAGDGGEPDHGARHHGRGHGDDGQRRDGEVDGHGARKAKHRKRVEEEAAPAPGGGPGKGRRQAGVNPGPIPNANVPSTPAPGPTGNPAPGPVPGVVNSPSAVSPPTAPPGPPRGRAPSGGAPAAGRRLGQVLTTVLPPAAAAPALLTANANPGTPSRRASHPGGGPKPVGPRNPLVTPVDTVISAVPTAIWVVLGALAALAAALGGTTLVAGGRARRRASAIRAIEGLAISDALTGVLNRGAFEERVRGELARARRYDRPLGLLTFDVAGLKAVNDAHGHSAGDEVLKSVASVIKESIRDHDLVGRMGGDEYAVVVTEQTRAGAERVLDRIQREVPKRRADLGLRTEWGLSAGIAEFPNDGDTAEALLKAADRRLYLSRGISIDPVS